MAAEGSFDPRRRLARLEAFLGVCAAYVVRTHARATGILWVEARDAAKHFTVHRAGLAPQGTMVQPRVRG